MYPFMTKTKEFYSPGGRNKNKALICKACIHPITTYTAQTELQLILNEGKKFFASKKCEYLVCISLF